MISTDPAGFRNESTDSQPVTVSATCAAVGEHRPQECPEYRAPVGGDYHYWVCVRSTHDVNPDDIKDSILRRWGHGYDDVSVAEMDTLRRAVWAWIISSNDGAGVDVGDLMSVLDRLGFPCPDDMDGED